MPKLVCETCGKEFVRAKPQPYCCYQCFQNRKFRDKLDNFNYRQAILESGWYKQALKVINENSVNKISKFEEFVIKECGCGHYRMFHSDEEFLEYCVNTVLERR